MNNVRRMRPLLGTFVEIGTDRTGGATAIDAAFRAVEAIHRLLSFQDPDSQLSRLNRSRGEFVPLDPLVTAVLGHALALGRASDGLFDCTVGGTLVRRGILPDHGGPEPLDRGVPDDVEVSGHSARLRRPVRISLDGIAKGFAVDCAVASLRARGVNAGWVNAGGDLRVFGDLALPVQRREPGGYRLVGRLRETALATSAQSPGWNPAFPAGLIGRGDDPVVAGTWSVTAPWAWLADALTKVAALAGPACRSERVMQLGGRLLPEAVPA